MANIAVATADRIEIVQSFIQHTAKASEAISAGSAVRLDTTTGKFTPANGSSTAEARIYGVATATVATNGDLTAIRKGILDGYTFSQAYDAAIYLSDTDGRLADAAGTVSVIVGRVLSAFGQTLGTAADKLLFVDL